MGSNLFVHFMGGGGDGAGRAGGTVRWGVEEWGRRHRLGCKGGRGSTRGILGRGRRGGPVFPSPKLPNPTPEPAPPNRPWLLASNLRINRFPGLFFQIFRGRKSYGVELSALFFPQTQGRQLDPVGFLMPKFRFVAQALQIFRKTEPQIWQNFDFPHTLSS